MRKHLDKLSHFSFTFDKCKGRPACLTLTALLTVKTWYSSNLHGNSEINSQGNVHKLSKLWQKLDTVCFNKES